MDEGTELPLPYEDYLTNYFLRQGKHTLCKSLILFKNF